VSCDWLWTICLHSISALIQNFHDFLFFEALSYVFQCYVAEHLYDYTANYEDVAQPVSIGDDWVNDSDVWITSYLLTVYSAFNTK
jgi:hypothetical protein